MNIQTAEMALHSGKETNGMTLLQAGQFIQMSREKAGYLTQGEFAKAVGVDKSLINAIENGRKRAGWDTYDTIARFLGISFEITIPIEEGRSIAADIVPGRK